MPGHRREPGEGGRVRFVPLGGSGPALELSSRVEKRFLGRTEIAVFGADLAHPLPETATIALRHTGGLKRSGVTASLIEGGDAAGRVARILAASERLSEALLPLDFTRFEIVGDQDGSRARVELMGATHVAIAMPPIRSYIHLYPDQREALLSGLNEVRRALASA